MRSSVILFLLSGLILFLALAAGIEASSQDNSNKPVEGVKFKPAIKDGVPVSTFMQFEFNLNCGKECP